MKYLKFHKIIGLLLGLGWFFSLGGRNSNLWNLKNKLENEFLITVLAVSTFKCILFWGMSKEHIYNMKIFISLFL